MRTPELCTGVLLVFASLLLVQISHQSGYTYPFGYYNISTEKKDVGFIQVFACSPTMSTIYFSMQAGIFNQYKLVERIQTFNLTIGYNQITVTGAPVRGLGGLRPYGMIISSDDETFVYGVKSDVGTTDGYLVPTITTNSTEFVIAGWVVTRDDFFAGLMIVAALDDTCVEIYVISENGTKYSYSQGVYLSKAYNFIEYYTDVNKDSTVLFVNSSRPVTVMSGVSCGNVSKTTYYCDHMAEVMPPISELGTVHVVPPIQGRSSAAGYLVRVVASQVGTTVTWTDVYANTQTGVTFPGVGFDIDTNDASVPIIVKCDKPCLVMLYNKGVQAFPGEQSFTDPFMMIITPVDHYVHGSCYGTAAFCFSVTSKVDFNNFLSAATALDSKPDILIDGSKPRDSCWIDIGDYSVCTLGVVPGFHTVTVVNGSTAMFGGWAYGHSTYSSSTSAYGYPIAYKMHGQPIDNPWVQADNARAVITRQSLATTCQLENITSGSAVAKYQSPPPTPYTLYQSIQLDASLKTPVSLSTDCRTAYIKALKDLLTATFRYINYQICSQAMCTYMTGNGGLKVSDGNFSAGIYPTTLFVAIDTTTVENNIQLDISNNMLTAIHLNVPYVGTLDTNVDAFSRCRTEIRDFLIPFVDWMTLNNNGFVPASAASLSSSNSQATLSTLQHQLNDTNQLLTAPSTCPSLNFTQARFSYSLPNRCT